MSDWVEAISTPLAVMAAVIAAIVALALYFLPTFVAHARRAEHFGWIALANFVAGVSVVGWVIVLIWALHDQPRPGFLYPRSTREAMAIAARMRE